MGERLPAPEAAGRSVPSARAAAVRSAVRTVRSVARTNRLACAGSATINATRRPRAGVPSAPPRGCNGGRQHRRAGARQYLGQGGQGRCQAAPPLRPVHRPAAPPSRRVARRPVGGRGEWALGPHHRPRPRRSSRGPADGPAAVAATRRVQRRLLLPAGTHRGGGGRRHPRAPLLGERAERGTRRLGWEEKVRGGTQKSHDNRVDADHPRAHRGRCGVHTHL